MIESEAEIEDEVEARRACVPAMKAGITYETPSPASKAEPLLELSVGLGLSVDKFALTAEARSQSTIR
ncbi:hypothetical protein EVAR_26789_1 [Eumeta japonica]|uniref:Uncharacterized protein n=1 Tax=Eumeta variegata TaxID=151549 RepID=A0A4C1WDB0_EUMVA|nr:hypothetical protein EVAR_26789_1 [Eumeta japonica]